MGFWCENPRKRDKIKIIFKKQGEGMDCTDRAQHTGWWQTHVNVVMNLWVPQNSRNSWTSYFSKQASSMGVVGWLVGWLVS